MKRPDVAALLLSALILYGQILPTEMVGRLDRESMCQGAWQCSRFLIPPSHFRTSAYVLVAFACRGGRVLRAIGVVRCVGLRLTKTNIRRIRGEAP